MKVDLGTYNNDWYKKQIGASRLRRVLWYCINAIVFNTFLFPFNGLKEWLLQLFGAKISTGVVIKPLVNIKYPWKLEIGENSWIGEGVWIDNLAAVKIGSNCCLSQGAFLLTGNHDFTSSRFELLVQEILLEDGVWIGAKAIICPGVVCRSHSVLTAHSIYQGNPAVEKRDRQIIK
jgi:putative colanic acid biosynthesis acetyltransferase WcaF